MANKWWSGVAGAFLTAGCLVIGLIANLLVSGDPFAVVATTDPIVEGSSVLFTTLFIAISGGHYIGASYDEDSSGRSFAIGSNVVLWLGAVGFIGYRASSGESFVAPALYGSVLVLFGGGVFALHRSDNLEQGSKLEEWIDHLSSKGTALVVTGTFIVRTVPDPTIAVVGIVVAALVGAFLWEEHGEQLQNAVETVEDRISELSTADD